MNIFVILVFFLALINYFLKKKPVHFIFYFTNFFELGGYFFTYKLFKKKIKFLTKKNSYKNFAIIVQGPIIRNANFTIETLKLYANKFPKSPIIFSSWKKDIQYINSKFINNKIFFISNEKPIYAGCRNINLQSISTVNAILYAKKLGCEYAIKTRSDTRLYSDNFQDDLIKLLKFYKLQKNLNLKQKKRIITTSFTLYYRLYQISDLIMCGNIDDLYNYYNVLTTKKIESDFIKLVKKIKFKDPLYELDHKSKEFCPELYFFYQFYKKMNIELKWTVSDSLKKISENFIVVNNQTLSVYFKKSNKIQNHFSKNPEPEKLSTEFNFENWLNYFYNSKNIKKL